MMQPELQDFRPVLGLGIDRVQFLKRLARHAQFGITAGGVKMAFEIHESLLSKNLAPMPSIGRDAFPGRPSKNENKSDGSEIRPYLQ